MRNWPHCRTILPVIVCPRRVQGRQVPTPNGVATKTMNYNKPNGGALPPNAALSPLHQFLIDCHAGLRDDSRGLLADYIPELKKADPHHFGISLTTIDGHVYEVGDTAVSFTIQSISKPFVFALALQTLGANKVEAVLGVEPSGDAFNSIRLRADNRPYNPMVNAGAIALLLWSNAEPGAGRHLRASLTH